MKLESLCRAVLCASLMGLCPLRVEGQQVTPAAPRAAPANTPAQMGAEALSRALLQAKAELHAAAESRTDNTKLSPLREQVATLQSEIAARSMPSVDVPVEPVNVGAMFPRIVEPEMQILDASSLTMTALSSGRADPSEPAENRAVLAALADTRVSLAGTHTLSSAIDMVRAQARCNIVVNWSNLEQSGVAKETSITLNVNNVSAEKVLELVLAQASPNVPLQFIADGGVVQISSREDFSRERYQVVRVYNVRDLVTPQFASSYPGNVQQQMYDANVNGLMTIVRELVSPNTWRDNGGTVGQIRELNGLLVVGQTAENQRAIEQLLKLMRQKGAN